MHVEGSAITQHGLVVSDVISKVTDGSVEVLMENRADHPQWLPAGTSVGSWSALNSGDQLIPVEDEVVNEEDSSSCLRAGKAEVACPPELLTELEAALPHLSGKDVTGGERVAMMNVFQSYQDVFELKSTELGRTDLVEHEIDVGDNSPVRQPPRRIPLHKVTTVQQAISDLIVKIFHQEGKIL